MAAEEDGRRRRKPTHQRAPSPSRKRAAVEQTCCGPRVRAIDEAERSGVPAPLFISARRRATAGGGDRRREYHLDPAGPFLQ